MDDTSPDSGDHGDVGEHSSAGLMHAAVFEPALLTGELPGIGGQLRSCDDDFYVDEIPAYPPDGKAGGWLFLQLRKRGMSTEDAVRALARALGLGVGDIGFAGRKDRDAVSRQWISVPVQQAARLATVVIPDVELGPAHLHSHKLRTGHLHGNRFDIVVRELACVPEVAQAHAADKLARLHALGGLTNAYGPQRFGDGTRGLERGLAAMLGGRGGSRGNMTVAAGQAALFNLYLELRVRRGLLRRALVGDILKKTDTGGLFVCSDAGQDDERLAAGALVVTGPIYGSRTMSPPAGTPSGALEREVLDIVGVDDNALRSLGRAALGTRRPLQVPIGDPETSWVPLVADSALSAGMRLVFTLPAGSFATALCRELQLGPTDPLPIRGHDATSAAAP